MKFGNYELKKLCEDTIRENIELIAKIMHVSADYKEASKKIMDTCVNLMYKALALQITAIEEHNDKFLLN